MLSFVRRFEVKIFTLEGEVHMEGARQHPEICTSPEIVNILTENFLFKGEHVV
jgi:hypothetical protein